MALAAHLRDVHGRNLRPHEEANVTLLRRLHSLLLEDPGQLHVVCGSFFPRAEGVRLRRYAERLDALAETIDIQRQHIAVLSAGIRLYESHGALLTVLTRREADDPGPGADEHPPA